MAVRIDTEAFLVGTPPASLEHGRKLLAEHRVGRLEQADGGVQAVVRDGAHPVRPGREHDLTPCLKAHPEILAALRDWTGDNLPALADLGYEGEPGTFTLPVKKSKNTTLTDERKQHNWLQAHARARAEQANAILKMTFKALRHVSLDPGRIGRIIAAALVILHTEHERTT